MPTDNKSDKVYAEPTDLDFARQQLQFNLAAVIARFEYETGVAVEEVKVVRETRDNHDNYTDLNAIWNGDGPRSYVTHVGVRLAKGRLVGPNMIELPDEEEIIQLVTDVADQELAAINEKFQEAAEQDRVDAEEIPW